MANLLRWSTGLTFPKKKEENNVLTTSTPLIRSLRTMNPTITNKANSATTTNTNNSFSNSIMRTQQINEQIRQQAEQRRQQEEQQRQQRLAEQQRQQEQRKQQEQAKRLAEQRLQEQKQRNLLNSAGLGNSGFGTTDLRSNLEARKQAIAKKQQEAAAKKAQEEQSQVDSALKTVNNDVRTKYNDLFKDEGNGWSNNSYWTKYRDNGTTANRYSSIYGESQQDLNRALRTIMSKDDNALGDADRIVSAYSKLSNDEKWSATQDLQKAATKVQQAMTKADNEGNTQARDSYGQALDYINTYQNLISGVDKGQKSFLKSLTDTMQTGNPFGIYDPLMNAIGDVTGNSDITKRIENEAQIQRQGNNTAMDIAEKGLNLGYRWATNVLTGGIANRVENLLNIGHEVASSFNDQDRQYYIDENGKVQRQNRTNEQKLASIGVAGLNFLLGEAGRRGLGPNMFNGSDTLKDLVKAGDWGAIAKEVLRYAADETPYATITAGAKTFIQSLGDGEEAWANFGDNFVDDLIGDISMDAAGAIIKGQTGSRNMFKAKDGRLFLSDEVKSKLSQEDNAKVQERLDAFTDGVRAAAEEEVKNTDGQKIEVDNKIETEIKTKDGVDLSRIRTTGDGTMVKTNVDGTATKLSDAELANVVEQRSSQPSTVKGLNPFIENSVKLGTSEDLNTLAKRAEQGDTYAKQRLAELTGQNEEENTDWRGKSVEDVINPENNDTEQAIRDTNFTFETDAERSNKYNKAIKQYYSKYGEDFYEKMPDYLQDVYGQMLDSQPRNADGVYIDPITGGEAIDTVVEGGAPDGRNLIKTDYNLPEDATPQEVSRAIRKTIQKRFQGNSYKVGDTDMKAKITRRSRNELEFQQQKMSDSDFVKKGSLVGNYDELIENMSGIRRVKNHKPNTKPNVAYYISGRVAVDFGNGEIYQPRIDLEVNKNGRIIGYDIADIRKFPRSKSQRASFPGDQTQVDYTGTYGRNSIVAQSDQNVQSRNDLSDSKKLMEIYYKQYGNNFYEAMPEYLQDTYEKLLDNQPKNEDGVYIDPITGEEAIDEIIAGAAPDGGDLVASDYPVSRDLPQKEAAREARQNLKKIQGRTIKLGDSDIEATFNKKNRGELMRRNDTMSGNQYRAKVDMAGNADELFSTARDVRVEPNRKPNQKPDVIGYVKGKSYGQDGSGKVYEMSVKSEINKNGATNPHSITSINEVPGGIIRKSGDQVRNAQAPRSASNIPQNNASVKNKSQFANETVQNSPEVSRDLKKQVRDEKATYRQTSNAEHLAASEKFMNTHTLSEAEADITNRVLNKKLGKITDQDVSDAIAVAKALDAKGDNASLERASIIYESLSKHATKQGQTIQALSLLNNRTPEGLRYGAEKAIRKSGTEITPEIHRQVLQNTDGIVKSRTEVAKAQKAFDNISEQATKLYESGDKISDRDYQKTMTDLDRVGRRLDNARYDLDLAYARLSKTVADNTKQNAGDIYSSIHKAWLLSSPTTHVRNITSNTTFNAMKKISDVGSTGLDVLVSKITGKRSKTFTMRGMLEGGKKGTRYGMETMRTGLDELNGTGKYDSGYPELRFKNSVADTIIGKPARIIFRGMSAGDKPFRYAAQANSLYDQASAAAKNLGLSGKGKDIFIKQYVSDPPQAALEIAQADGEKAVLGQSNKIAQKINEIVQSAKNSDNIGYRILGTYLDAHVVPFNKVPTNFLIESANYTPVGAVKEGFKMINDARKGKGFDQRAFVESISKSTIGTAGLLALGGLLADNFTGEYPDDEKERNRWEAEGIKENSFKIGDRYVPQDAFGPNALLMGAGATFWKSMKAGDSVTDATGEAMAQLVRNLEDQSFLTGVSNLIDTTKAIVNKDRAKVEKSLSSYIKQEVSSNIPNIVKKLASATDPYVRSTGKKDGLVEQTVASLMNSIPGLRELLPTKVDVYGNDLKNGSFLTGFLDPTGSGYALQDGNQMIEEVARLHNIANSLDLTEEEAQELEVTPTDVEYNFGAKGNEVQLTDDEQRELTKITGGLISTTWQDIMNSDDYKNSDDLRKARLLADGRQAAVNLAKQQFADAHGYTAPKMTSDAKALENGSFKASAKGDTARNNAIEANDSIPKNPSLS